MRLDNACFVLTKPKVPSMPTRRAFLIAGGMFVAGTALGGACGYSAGVAAGNGEPGGAAEPNPAPAAEIKLEPSGDAELDALRRLAVQAPLDELFAKWTFFMDLRTAPYSQDVILWKGVERMTLEIVNNPDRRVDPMLIATLISTIGGTGHPDTPSLREHLPALRLRKAAEQRRK
ncbi:MAG: hypothetical protein JNK15_08360 [Planctomycetes bacterium]|nr:hypothetical protein [Planctomycetota bacterium]